MVVPKKSELVKTHNAPRHRQANEMEWEGNYPYYLTSAVSRRNGH